MSHKSSSLSTFAASILVAVNIIVMMISIMLFAVALWIISSITTLATAVHASGITLFEALLPNLSLQLGVSLAVISVFIFFISFMGFHGAMSRSPFLLFMYSALIFLLFLLECSLFYYFTSNFLERGLESNESDWEHSVRIIFQCCNKNITELHEDPVKLPWSCCSTASRNINCTLENIFKKDCNKTISEWIYKYRVTIYASLGAVHLILLSCSLIRRSSVASQSIS